MVKYNLEYYEEKLRSGNTTPHMINKWVSKLDIVIHVANNEQKAWTEDMLGHSTIGMPTKAVSGYRQVGDYHMYLNDYDKFVGICGERKSLSDLYGTLFKGRVRFDKEIERAKIDDRFDIFIVFAEGTMTDFITYEPKWKGTWYKKQAAVRIKRGAAYMEKEKLGAINSLYARYAGVYFCGSRPQAAKNFVDICHKWIGRNFSSILQIE